MEISILIILFVLGFYIVSLNPRKNFLLTFVLAVYLIYWLLGPMNTLDKKYFFHLGANFENYFDDVIIIYIISLSALLLSYIVGNRLTLSKLYRYKRKIYRINKNYKVYLLLFFLAVTFIVNRKSSAENLEYSGGFLNYLLFLSDSLILGFTILIYEKKFKKWHLILLIITLLYYLFLGFRYRIILFLLALLYHYYIILNLSFKTILKWSFLIIVIAYLLNFITNNRDAFRQFELEKVTLKSETAYEMTPYELVMHQTDNHKTDMVAFKYLQENSLLHDYGESMFLNIFYRIIPANFFDDNTKPKVPQQEIIRNSFGTNEGFYAGAAVTNALEYYIAYSYYGVVFFMGIIGFVMGKLSKNTNLSIPRDRVKIIIFAMFIFQEITRAYLPQNITLLVFLLLTFKLFYRPYARHNN